MKNKIVAMIPARLDSARFPGKLLKDLGGESVILKTYKATKATQLFDQVFVVTDSTEIYDEIVNHGGQAIYSKTKHETGSDRIAAAVQAIKADIVVNVQGDEPFTSKALLEKLLAVFDGNDAHKIDLATPMTELKNLADVENPNNVKVITDTANFALYFSRSVIPYWRAKNHHTKYYKHIGIYAFKKQALLDFAELPMETLEASEKIECLRYLEFGKKIKMVETNEVSIGIDTPEDLKKAKELLD